jgi:hypothetical protein
MTLSKLDKSMEDFQHGHDVIEAPLIGNNIEIHLVFTWCNILFPFVSNNSASLHFLNYLLAKEKKKYVECKSFSIFCIRGCFENVCTIKLIMCATQWTTNNKRISLWDNQCGHTTIDTSENNTIWPKTYQFVDFS